jgi:hypothetical protein
MKNDGLIEELSNCFADQASAIGLLGKIGIKPGRLPAFGSMAADQWWYSVCVELERGLIDNGLERLLNAAADTYPGNPRFKDYLTERSKPDNRGSGPGNIDLTISGNMSDNLLLEIIDRAARFVKETGGDFVLNLGRQGSSRFNLSVEGVPPDEIDRIVREIERICEERGVQAQVNRTSYTFRDYYSDPLTAEGPDGQRFALEQIRASTPVKDIARGVMNSYKDDVWPMTKTGQRQQAVIDRVTPEGTVRLDPRQTLHDAGVRPGDTLQVSPERTAGAVDPLLREEALARVRVQVLDHATANPGFEVEANSLVAPTEYLFRFQAPSFAPPLSPDEPPRPIKWHEVLVELPPDFPIEAPLAWWQTEIFHPNIHPETGLVCLGDLQENYQPGLDFGELCKMLVDIAAYRSYAFDKGYFDEAAAKWALSAEGQLAIEQAGGFSLIRRLVEAGQPQQPLRIRRIDQ